MIFYTPSSAGQELSAALWALARPLQLEGKAGTKNMFDTITALDGSTWLEVVNDYEISIHPQAEIGEIADILQPWIDSGDIPADTNAQLTALVESKRGQKLVVYEAFPALFKLKSMENPTGLGRTREQMIQENRLSNPILP